MQVGDTTTLSGYDFRFDGITQAAGPNYSAIQGHLTVSKQGRQLAILTPQKRLYTVQNMPMTEAGVAAGLWSDQYASLGEGLADGSWSIRLYYKPMVNWIWGGCLLMALGGVLALSDKRYRLRKKTVSEPGIVPVQGAIAGAKRAWHS